MSVLAVFQSYGLVAVFAFVALEATGVPLPGETALVLAAAYAGRSEHLGLGEVLAVAVAAAVLGDNLGYLLGRRGGWPLVRRYGRFLRVRSSHVKVGRYLFARHGGRLVLGGRFISVLRAYVAILAGVNHMPWGRFLVWNAAGGVLWATTWTLAAYSLGARVAEVSRPVQVVLVGVVVGGVIGTMLVVRRRWKTLSRRAEAAYPGPLV